MFRSELYYYLKVLPIAAPALSERRQDIPLPLQSFIEQFNRRMGKHVESIHPDALQHFLQRDWPGNVRELKHVVQRAMILCDDADLTIEALTTAPD